MREQKMPDATGWQARIDGGTAVLTLAGDWTDLDAIHQADLAGQIIDRDGLQALSLQVSEPLRWNSALLVFVSTLQRRAAERALAIDDSGLSASSRDLLQLAAMTPVTPAVPARPVTLLGSLGGWTLQQGALWSSAVSLLGDQILATLHWIRGRARTRGVDLLINVRDAGIAALPMVALVNLMVGGILAFVGVVQLRRFGASIYVADLVGVGVVREMAPLMLGIVMSGRTGSAYAAELASMQGSEQTDALRALGIPIRDYLVLPRVSALCAMMPLLYLYAGAIGIGGGFVVAVTMLKISPEAFISQLRSAVTGAELVFGLTKSLVFGAWIGITGCRLGLAAGRSTTEVGHAATAAAVTGIAGVIVLDALFAACANIWGI
jgi:phospholipid/cholesterol/gamma-HCH transport system permease protein